MIFVTIGTNDKPFVRLLKAIEDAIKDGVITDKVVVQSGYTDYKSDYMEVFSYMDRNEFANYLETADLVITHGGVGTIMTALKKGRKIIGCARLKEYQEHVNDHQTEILEAFEKKGYLVYMKDFSTLNECIKRAMEMDPKPLESNTVNMIALIENWMDEVEK